VRRYRWFAESFGVAGMGGVQDDGAVRADLVRGAVVHRGRGVQAEGLVTVDVVVVVEERLAERSGVGE